MLIVCPSCTTSYQIDPAAVGPVGRMVRCARCKTTWFAPAPKPAPEVTAFVDNVIAEAEEQTIGIIKPDKMPDPGPEPVYVPNVADHSGAGPHRSLPEQLSRQPEPATPAHEPITIADAPSLVPPIEQAPLPDAASAEPDPEGIETFAVRRQRLKMRRQQARRSSRWTAIVLVLLAFNLAVIGARDQVVRFLPQTASLFAVIGLPVNLRNMKFENVRISKEAEDGVNSLIIEGYIVSTASRPTEVPRLRFAARNAAGQEVYSWTAQPSRSIIEPGERLEFSSRLASPPADASDIMVRFFNSQDAVPGAK